MNDIKYLTDKFDNRIWRVTRYIDSSSRGGSYARIDPNMDSISPQDRTWWVKFNPLFGHVRMRRGEGEEGKGEPPFSSLCLFNHDMYISCVTVIVLPVVLLVLADELKKINFESENFRSPFCQPSNRNPIRKITRIEEFSIVLAFLFDGDNFIIFN